MSDRLDIDDTPHSAEAYTRLYADYEAEKGRRVMLEQTLSEVTAMLRDALEAVRRK